MMQRPPFISLNVSGHSLRTGLGFHFPRRSGEFTRRNYLRLPRKRCLYETYKHYKFIWNGKVPYG